MEDNVLSIHALGREFKSITELKKYSESQFVALKKAAEKITTLEEEVVHLKTLLESTTHLLEDSNIERILKSPEESICDKQIEMLQGVAFTRQLTLEETKQLDLFIKNKRLAKEQSTVISGEVKKRQQLPSLPPSKLIELANKPDDNV